MVKISNKITKWATLILIVIVLITCGFYAFTWYMQGRNDDNRKSDISTIVKDSKSFMGEFKSTYANDAFHVMSDASYTRKLSIIEKIEWSGLDWDGIQPTTKVALFSPKDCDGKSGQNSFSVTILLENGKKYCQGS